MIDAFNEYGHFFTVIHYENNSNYKKLAAQCFTNLYCVPDEFSQFKCILSFYPNRHTELLEDCPLVTYHSIERYEILKQGKGICDKIKELLNEGYYLTFYVDLFFLPCSESYQKNHLNHKIMVFGYDEEQMKFAVIDTFRNFKYAASEVSFDELETAFNSYEHAKNQRDNKVVYVKFQNQEVTIDITKLKKNLECFCKENEERGIVSGVKVYDELEKGLHESEYLHLQSCNILCQHITFTKIRAKLLKELEIAEFSKKEWEQFEELEKQSKSLCNLYRKYKIVCEIRPDDTLLNQVNNYLKQVKEKHVEVINTIVNKL